MQAGIDDLTACFNEEFVCKYVTDWASKLKISVEAGNLFFDFSNDIDDENFESSATHSDTPKVITAEQLRKVWRVSNEVTQQTLDVTTQLNNENVDSTLSHSFSTIGSMLRYKRLDSIFYTDTFYSKQVVSKRGFSMMQIFVTHKNLHH